MKNNAVALVNVRKLVGSIQQGKKLNWDDLVFYKDGSDYYVKVKSTGRDLAVDEVEKLVSDKAKKTIEGLALKVGSREYGRSLRYCTPDEYREQQALIERDREERAKREGLHDAYLKWRKNLDNPDPSYYRDLPF